MNLFFSISRSLSLSLSFPSSLLAWLTLNLEHAAASDTACPATSFEVLSQAHVDKSGVVRHSDEALGRWNPKGDGGKRMAKTTSYDKLRHRKTFHNMSQHLATFDDILWRFLSFSSLNVKSHVKPRPNIPLEPWEASCPFLVPLPSFLIKTGILSRMTVLLCACARADTWIGIGLENFGSQSLQEF